MMQWGDPQLPDAFWRRCVPEPNTGCWLMLGRTVSGGYTQIKHLGRYVLCHRFAYVAAGHELPEFKHGDRELDHLCRTPCCAAPHHLELATHQVNVERASRIDALIARGERCPRGHAYTPDNIRTDIAKDGRERHRCLACWVELLASRKRARAERRSARLQR